MRFSPGSGKDRITSLILFLPTKGVLSSSQPVNYTAFNFKNIWSHIKMSNESRTRTEPCGTPGKISLQELTKVYFSFLRNPGLNLRQEMEKEKSMKKTMEKACTLVINRS